MEVKFLIVLAGVVLGILLFLGKRAYRRYRIDQGVKARLDAYVPGRRTIVLSAQDRRGWATDAAGWMRPR